MTHDASSITPGATYDVARRVMVVSHLEIDDPIVLNEIRHWADGQRGPAAEDAALAQADLSPFCRQAIVTGAAAIRAAGGVQETRHLDSLISELGDRATQVSEQAAATATTAATQATTAMANATAEVQRNLLAAGKVAREELADHVERARALLVQEMQRLVGGDDPVLGAKLAVLLQNFSSQLDERINTRTDDLFAKAARQLDPRDPTSPLAEFTKRIGEQHEALSNNVQVGQRAIEESLDKLTAVVNAATATTSATAAIRAVSPLKGTAYADAVHQQIQTLAGIYGDEYIDTSTTTGLVPRCRKGDGVLIVPNTTGSGAGRIVIEMTDSDTARRQWTDYLDEAERNRDAVASLGIVRTIEQLAGGERLRIFGPRRIVVVHDPAVDDPALLRAVVLLLRAQATVTMARSGGEHLKTAEEKLSEAVGCLERLAEVQKAAGNIRKGADKIDGDCAWLHTSLQRLLSEASAALASGSGDEGAVSAA